MLVSADVLSITELNRRARATLEREFPLLWVAGEISNLTRAASGHLYFSLKDDAAQARCVMFRSRASSVSWHLENGQQVEAHALVSLYEPRGDFQLNIESLRRAGLGRLFEAFARLKERLETEGLFADARKRQLPRFPRRVGIITSPGAAALRDVLVALKRRAPHLPVDFDPRFWNVAPPALRIARGGGSIEDLWAYNEEVVARAIAASNLPVISGIGHETDTTIADLAADLRAATPTAAAELATQGWHEAAAKISELGTALGRAARYRVARDQQRVDHLSLRLVHPATRLGQARDRLALLGSQLDASLARNLRQHRDRLNRAALGLSRTMPRTEKHRGGIELLVQRLAAAIREQHGKRVATLDNIAGALSHLNPDATLARGFSVVRDAHGKLVTDASRQHAGQRVDIYLAHGSAEAGILTCSPDHGPVAT